jgi:phosphonate transport system permease protein
MSDPRTLERLRILRLSRPRSRFLRWSSALILLLVIAAWWAGDFAPSGFLSPRRLENLQRFLAEIRPYPLHDRPWDWGVAWAWARDVAVRKGTEATFITLALSVVSIVLASLGGLLLALPAARTWSTPEPYLPASRRIPWPRRAAWRGLVTLSRGALVLLRALPEYIWAFIFLTLIGPTAWPIVLALAIHNIGILGKLDAEVIENLPPRPLAALRGMGAGRLGIAGVAIFPSILPRFLLLFFYRWETCVRESTVLGMLGIASLGFWIVDARARQLYDEMIFLVLLGALLVLAGDLVSAAVRGRVRRAD